MKYTTFTFNTNKKNNGFNINNGSTNYSKTLDDIILSNLKSKTPYIFKDATLSTLRVTTTISLSLLVITPRIILMVHLSRSSRMRFRLVTT